MKKKIILKRVFHRNKWCILIIFRYDESLTYLARQIKTVRFSGTYKSWYADDSEETLKNILLTFKNKADIDISELKNGMAHKDVTSMGDDRTCLPEELKKRGNSQSESPEGSHEIIPDRVSITRLVQRQRYDPVEFRVNEKGGKLAIRFTGRYRSEWVEEIRSYGKCFYDRKRKEFLLPWSLLSGDSLSDYFASIGVVVKVIKTAPSVLQEIARKEMGDEVRSRELGPGAAQGLKLMRRYLDEVRYSERTNESYLSLVEFFFKYFNEKNPLDISAEEISDFIHDFIIANGYSKSYQNQMISAIKIYFRIAGRSRMSIDLVERPRRSRALPKVFSKEEVQKILNSTRNIKHKLLLWLIYSCGLRRSEVCNIRLTDLDRARNIIHVKEGKGSVDRIVPVSKKVWEKLDEYFGSFRPKEYLFEGQTGGRYSVESVYRVFKQALLRAGIKKEVGVHSLRHSYATHLHESGLDIRYIQELLGHKSMRTTEIYTHVSRRNLAVIRSPIEDMDVK